MQTERILIVEDEPVVALDLQQSLMEIGHDVTGISTSFFEAITAVEISNPSLILMDIHLDGDIDGIEACNEIYRRWKLPVIFLTAYADDKTVTRAAESRPFGYVMKPFETKELSAVIQVARARHDTEMSLAKSEARLAIALEAADLGTWEWEAQLDQIHGDARFHQIWGSALRPFHANLDAMLDRIHPDDRDGVEVLFQHPGFFSSIFRALRERGEYAWLEMHGKLLRSMQGHPIVIGALRDVTPRKTMEENLRQASVVFSTAVEGMLILDVQGKVVNANPAFYTMTGYCTDDIHGKLPNEFLMIRRESDPSYEDIAVSKEGFWTGEVPCKRKDGSLFSTLQHICVVRDEKGNPDQFVLSISDISFIREAERQLDHLAVHDPLTGLGNRYLLDQRLTQELVRAQLSGGRLAIIFIDLDGFKAINDSMGHHVGDRLIQEVAKRILNQIRRHDEAIRLGGDEFVVIVPDLHHPSEGQIVADKILKALSVPISIDEQQLRISASIGIARYPGDGAGLSELLSAADSAMYEAKRQGKGRVCYYSSDMTENVRTRLNIEQGLHSAIQDQELVLYYQPVIDIQNNKLLGFEALIRWNHPVSGLLSPDKFIQIAEESGLIEPIGDWVLNQALSQLKLWSVALGREFFMAVNVSPRQFLHEDFLPTVESALARHQIDARFLELEITESTLQDFQRSRRVVSGIRELGASVAIDDFGTGYSSIALLKHLPVSRIKIDRSFVIALPGSAGDVGLISAILEMARSLGLDVTAEGIETQEQASVLREMGCPAIQGYFFGKPLPAESYTKNWFQQMK